MRRSTVWTRRWGSAALICAAVAAPLPLLRYGAPVPRWDLLFLLGASLLCGLAWVAASWRAPRFTAPPDDAPVAPAAPVITGPLPAVIPRSTLASLGRLPAVALAGCALVPALLLGSQPDGHQGRVLAGIQDAGAVVSTGTITGVSSEEKSSVGVSGRKFGSYWYADLAVELSDGTRLTVDRGIVAGLPHQGDEVEVLHSPGRPELGGRVDGSTDLGAYVQTWRPPLAGGPWLATFLAVIVVLAAVGHRHGASGPRRVLAQDAAAGRVKALRVSALTAVRDEHTTVGARAGTTRVDVRRTLYAVHDGGRLRLLVPDIAIPALAAEFGPAGGRLMWATRWRLVRESRAVDCVFVAADGRIFPCAAFPSDLRRLREREVASEQPTDPSFRVRDWPGLCGTSPGVRLGLVALYAAVGACAVPVLTGTASYLTGYLPLVGVAVAGVAAAVLATRSAPMDDLPVWERRRSRDRRLRAG
ncbi:hypothetical protein [Streptomyces sp. NPDC000351]|uniref:hypothetical protein n=1 Tax=Streptomyces sp. NPDC000351 TaxID=3154250 RepID=UPI00333029B4